MYLPCFHIFHNQLLIVIRAAWDVAQSGREPGATLPHIKLCGRMKTNKHSWVWVKQSVFSALAYLNMKRRNLKNATSELSHCTCRKRGCHVFHLQTWLSRVGNLFQQITLLQTTTTTNTWVDTHLYQLSYKALNLFTKSKLGDAGLQNMGSTLPDAPRPS